MCQPGAYSIIGPATLTQLLVTTCGGQGIQSLYHQTPTSCTNITIYPSHYFYPIGDQMTQQFFNEEGAKKHPEVSHATPSDFILTTL